MTALDPGRLLHLRILLEEGPGRWKAVIEVKKKKRERETEKRRGGREQRGMGWGWGNKRTKLNTERRDWKVLLQRDTAERERERRKESERTTGIETARYIYSNAA